MLLLGGNPQQAAVDPYFYSVTSLLHGDGTNGGQNNTFLDSSSNNFTITRNGNTTQGSFSPFSQTGWGNYFDGTGDYLIITSGLTNQFHPGSAFTFEGFFYINDTADEAPFYVGGSTVDWNASTGVLYQLYISSGTLYWQFNGGGAPVSMTTSAPAKDQWVHIAVGYNGTTTRMWVNGTSVATSTSSYTVPTYTAVSIGAQRNGGSPYTGYASNLRFVKGTDVYGAGNTSITVPTTPLTAITNTQLLTCQANRFLDASSNAFAITANGNTSVQPFSPFNPITPYSTSSIGGSGYFDGSGDWITTPNVSAFDLSSSSVDFTIEAWVYNSNTAISGIIGARQNAQAQGWCLYIQTNNTLYMGSVIVGNSYADRQMNTTVIPPNTWAHVALVKTSSGYTAYVNGVGGTLLALTGGLQYQSTQPVIVGALGSQGELPFLGYISNVRIVKGTAVYTSNFTPPTAPLTAITNTSYLLNFTNGAIFDNAAVADYETVGNAQISTSVKKYGTGSMAFDGTGDRLVAAPIQTRAPGTGDFCYEFWFYANTSSNACLFDTRAVNNNTTGFACLLNGSSQIALYTNSTILTCGLALSASIWYHIAVTRTAGIIKIFVNGTVVGTLANTSNFSDRTLQLGQYIDSTGSLNGYIDDFRSSNGIGRYAYNFTPPTAEFPNIGGTVTLTADPYFDYTTLLLPGNGTNGAQNNTFLDSSTNNFTITRNGNTTQGTFSPFSQTGWGNYFDGNGDYLRAAANAAFEFGSGDFTVECWVYAVKQTNTFCQTFVSKGLNTSTGAEVWFIQLSSTGYLGFNSGNGGAVAINDSVLFPLNQWTHVAAVRNGGTFSLYKNGTLVGTASATAVASGGDLYIGGQWYDPAAATRATEGYISNVRVVKGTAVYTANFTPSTTPLTAITNTSLLTCQSNRFIDNSTNAFAITRNGDVSVQAFSPFNPTAAWSAATYGGSGYFDGSGDYLASPANSALALGTGDFTLECWVYATSTPSDVGIYEGRSNGNAGTVDGFTLTAFSGSVIRIYSNAILIASSGTSYVNVWCHVAVVRASGTWTLYINGVSQGTSTTSRDLTNNDALIGAGRYGVTGAATAYFPGYISNFRLVKGTAVYTANFTPPTAPPTAIANTSLLTNFTNAGIYDATSKNDLETVGNAQISTTQSKFGGSSMAFDGTGDWLVLPPNPPNNLTPFGTGDFTVEFWVRFSSFYNYISIVSSTRGANGFNCGSQAAAQIVWYANGAERVRGTTTLSANTWYHIAFVRYSGTLKGYVNGVQEGTTYADSINYSTPIIRVGDLDTGGEAFTGYINDLRITKGIARYTSNFTPPTTAFLTL